MFQTKNTIRFGRIVVDQVLCSLARTSDADWKGGREPWRWTQVVGYINWWKKRRADTSVQYFKLSLFQMYSLKSCHFQVPIGSCGKCVRQSVDCFLKPKTSEGTRGLTSTDDDALATGSFLLESEYMRLCEVTYVDPASTCVGKEVVSRRVGLGTVGDVVVE